MSHHNAFVAESYSVIREIAVKVFAFITFEKVPPGDAKVRVKFKRDLSNRKQLGGIMNSVGPTDDVIDDVTLLLPWGATLLKSTVE
jgi:hypothetical protein